MGTSPTSSASTPRRVLMTADTVGGVWTYALALAGGLAGRGIEVVLATMGGLPDPGQVRAAAAIPGLRLEASAWKLEWMEDPWDDLARSKDWLAELAARVHPDLVHLNTYVHGTLPWDCPVVGVGHSCVLSWWHAVHGGEPPAAWDRYRREVAAGLRGCGLVVAPSAAMLAELYRHYAPLPPAVVIANGLASSRFSADRVKQPLVFSAGRLWDEAKNLAQLARVAPRLPWPVAVAGDPHRPPGAGHDRPHQAALRHGAPLRLLGRLDGEAMAAMYAQSAVYALPARYEPFGLSVLEAALSACALVLGDIPSLRETWGDAALYVDPDDDDALVATLSRVCGDRALRERMSGRAHERAAGFGITPMVDAYLAAYAHLLHAARKDHACVS